MFRLLNDEAHQMVEAETLIRLTAGIVSAHAEGNSVPTTDLPALIGTVHDALARLGREEVSDPEVPFPMRVAGAVSVRKSLANPDKILSMIDGKPYSTLKRHIARHGFTPETYRERFGLKPDYPMVAPAYSDVRKAAAAAIGLGRKVVGAVAVGAAAVALAEALVPTPRRSTVSARKPRAAEALPEYTQEPMALVETARETPGRGRRAKAATAEAVPAVEGEAAPPLSKRRGRSPAPPQDPGSSEPLAGAPVPKAGRARRDKF